MLPISYLIFLSPPFNNDLPISSLITFLQTLQVPTVFSPILIIAYLKAKQPALKAKQATTPSGVPPLNLYLCLVLSVCLF